MGDGSRTRARPTVPTPVATGPLAPQPRPRSAQPSSRPRHTCNFLPGRRPGGARSPPPTSSPGPRNGREESLHREPRECRPAPALPSQLLVQSPAGGSGAGRGRKRRGRSGSRPGRGARGRGPALGFRPGSRPPGCRRPQQRGLRVGGAGRGGPGHPLRSRPAARGASAHPEAGGRRRRRPRRRRPRRPRWEVPYKAATRPGPTDSPPRFPWSARRGRGLTPDRPGLRRTPALDSRQTDRGSGQTSDGRRTPAPSRVRADRRQTPARSQLRTDIGRILAPDRPQSRADRRHTAARSRLRRPRTDPGPAGGRAGGGRGRPRRRGHARPAAWPRRCLRAPRS